MAGASLLALLDDIASVLDDVSLMTKAASKKTVGVLGDDIALNAQQVTGVVANRELPVVWAVAKGSFVNKLILVPVALAISAFLPVAITPLLMIGGIYLCYEGVEKIVHSLFHRHDRAHLDPAELKTSSVEAVTPVDAAATSDAGERLAPGVARPPGQPTPEQAKIKGAIRTDFILSAEIIAITLGTVASVAFSTQALVVSIVALSMTVGVYGLVAGIVKLDDAGLYLTQRKGPHVFRLALRGLGVAILLMAPYLMKVLSIAGTVAMFLVGGGILVHGLPSVEAWIHDLIEPASGASGFMASTLALVGPPLGSAIVGIVAGVAALALVSLFGRARQALA